jgi:hypothetical protein
VGRKRVPKSMRLNSAGTHLRPNGREEPPPKRVAPSTGPGRHQCHRARRPAASQLGAVNAAGTGPPAPAPSGFPARRCQRRQPGPFRAGPARRRAASPLGAVHAHDGLAPGTGCQAVAGTGRGQGAAPDAPCPRSARSTALQPLPASPGASPGASPQSASPLCPPRIPPIPVTFTPYEVFGDCP